MLVFQQELQDGLGEQLQNRVIAYTSRAELCDPFEIPGKALARLQKSSWATAKDNFDLHYLKTILVSTVWNKNDDVFDAYETWLARATPEDKMFNYEHDSSDIIGHITSCWCIDDEGNVLADETTADDLPNKYHIATGAVLYKIWSKEDLQDRMDQILAEIPENKWFVSMECLFRGFDYALKGSNHQRIIARNEETAFLTKHLRAYGGSGYYNGERIGRVLRNITFSGKGLVRRPANEESIIFAGEQFFTKNIFQNFSSVGYSSANSNKGIEMNEAELKQQNAELTRKNAELEKALRDNDVQKVQAKVDEVSAQKQAVEAELTKANEQLKTLQDELKAKADELKLVHEKLTESDKLREQIEVQLAEIRNEQKRQERIQAAVEKLSLSKEDAQKLVDGMNVDDAAFEAHIEVLAKYAPLPPKSTSVPEAPKSTSAPAPMKGEGSEVDDKGEAAASETDLEEVEEEKEVAGVTPEDDKLDNLCKQVAACFE